MGSSRRSGRQPRSLRYPNSYTGLRKLFLFLFVAEHVIAASGPPHLAPSPRPSHVHAALSSRHSAHVFLERGCFFFPGAGKLCVPGTDGALLGRTSLPHFLQLTRANLTQTVRAIFDTICREGTAEGAHSHSDEYRSPATTRCCLAHVCLARHHDSLLFRLRWGSYCNDPTTELQSRRNTRYDDPNLSWHA